LRVHILEAFRLTLIGRKRQNEGKRISVWIFIMLDKWRENFKDKGLMRQQRELVDNFFLSAQNRVQSFNENGF